jgi:hypothetical protein
MLPAEARGDMGSNTSLNLDRAEVSAVAISYLGIQLGSISLIRKDSDVRWRGLRFICDAFYTSTMSLPGPFRERYCR